MCVAIKTKVRRHIGLTKPTTAPPPAAGLSRSMKAFLWGLLILGAGGLIVAFTAPRRTEKSPPIAPVHFFNDYAHLVSPEFATGKDFWIHISPRAQFVTVVYPRSPEGSIDEFTARAAQAWKIGEAGANNGLILFVFREERTLRLKWPTDSNRRSLTSSRTAS
jgi:hypothetical protein